MSIQEHSEPWTHRATSRSAYSGTSLAGGATVGMIFLLLPSGNSHSGPSRRYRMQEQPQTDWSRAMHNYHDEFGCLPPAYVADAQGKTALQLASPAAALARTGESLQGVQA